MKVPYSYLKEQFQNSEPIFAHIRELLDTGEFTLGPAVARFEEKIAKLCQTKFAVGVNSGTDALFLSLKALGIGPGDEVITVPNTFYASVGAIVIAGATPVFVDTGENYTIDVNLIERAITKRTKAILPVHLTGCPADMSRILEIAKAKGLFVIEDAAQAVGASINGKRVGSFGNAGAFSLHPLKNLNVWGDGGFITTNDEDLAKRLRLMRNHGMQTRDVCVEYGYNSRLDTLQALVALDLVDKVAGINEERNKHAVFYDGKLREMSEWIHVPARAKNVYQAYHTYVIQVKNRDALNAYLLANGIDCKIHYPIPLHLQPASQYLGYKKGDFLVTEKQCDSILTLPIHQHLQVTQMEYVVQTIRQFYEKH